MDDSLFVISGPSGVGKTVLVRALLQACPHLRMTRSYTTREPRQGEIDGVQYHFVSEETFRGMIVRDEFVEWVYYPRDSTTLYGTPRSEMRSRGNKLLEIETQGAQKIKAMYPEAVLVFIWTDLQTIRKRLVERGGLSEAEMERRLATAETEMSEAQSFFDHFIENADGPVGLQKAVYQTLDIVNV